jgi:hypothetical protein
MSLYLARIFGQVQSLSHPVVACASWQPRVREAAGLVTTSRTNHDCPEPAPVGPTTPTFVETMAKEGAPWHQNLGKMRASTAAQEVPPRGRIGRHGQLAKGAAPSASSTPRRFRPRPPGTRVSARQALCCQVVATCTECYAMAVSARGPNRSLSRLVLCVGLLQALQLRWQCARNRAALQKPCAHTLTQPAVAWLR